MIENQQIITEVAEELEDKEEIVSQLDGYNAESNAGEEEKKDNLNY